MVSVGVQVNTKMLQRKQIQIGEPVSNLTFQDLVDFVEGNKGSIAPDVPVLMHSTTRLIWLSNPSTIAYEVVPESDDPGVVVISGG